MGGIGALSSALSGLTSAQASLDVIANNIANANTAGFTRKELPLGSRVLNGQGAGVRVENVIRSVDFALQRDLFQQTSITQQFLTKRQYFDQVQAFHGDPALGLDIGSKIATLADAFASLENSPEDIFEIENTREAARDYAGTLNAFSNFITQLRNDTQTQIQTSVDRINTLLSQIESLNADVVNATRSSRSIADLEDLRDIAVRDLSEELEIDIYISGDNVLNVLTQDGTQLTGTRGQEVFFEPTPISPNDFYPDSAAGILVGETLERGRDITLEDLKGNLGALIELRDQILPQYQAQVDELAIRTAERFASQGLELFTGPDGTIPDGTSPQNYIGFATVIQVNNSIQADANLIRTGTVEGLTVPDGSNEIIRRINEFTFGLLEENTVNGTIVDGTVVGVDLGFGNIFNARGTADLVVDPLAPITLDSLANINIGVNDSFEISTDDGLTFTTITIGAGDTAADLVTQINATFPGLATLNTSGQLVLGNNSGLIVNDVNLGAAGLADLGIDGFVGTGPIPPVNLNPALGATTIFSALGDVDISALATLDADPNINPALGAGGNDTFQISINGGGTFAQIEIQAGDTAADLVNRINAVFPDLAALTSGGQLLLRNTEGILVQDVNLGPAGTAALGIDDIIAGGAVQGFAQNTDPGLTSVYNAQGTVNVGDLTSLDELLAIEPDLNFDTFQISVDGGPFFAFEIQAGESAQSLVNRINGVFPGLARINELGQFEFENNVGFELQNVNLSDPGIEALGLENIIDAGPITPTHPNFTLQFGNELPVQIDLLPTDTPTDIVNRINAAIPDVTASYDNTTGEFLVDPNNGGDITIVDGFQDPLATLGLLIGETSHFNFQTTGLGPNADINSGVVPSTPTLLQFAQSMIAAQSRDNNINELNLDTEEAFRNNLESTILNESAVNVDAELTKLITIQTAFAASARVVTTVEELLDELVNAF